jgi:hypothetical protein
MFAARCYERAVKHYKMDNPNYVEPKIEPKVEPKIVIKEEKKVEP